MTTTDLHRQIVSETTGLSADLLSEIVDFVQFLKRKKTNHLSVESRSDFSQKETQHLEDEFADYKSLYPVD